MVHKTRPMTIKRIFTKVCSLASIFIEEEIKAFKRMIKDEKKI